MTRSTISAAPSRTWPASPGSRNRRFRCDARGVTKSFDTHGMDQRPRLVSITTRLSSPELGLDVEIRLRELDGRWLAVAEFDGDPEVGIGATPRAALAASLATLGDRSAAALMADPALFGASVSLRQLA